MKIWNHDDMTGHDNNNDNKTVAVRIILQKRNQNDENRPWLNKAMKSG